jgi:archaellum component FlaC
MAPLFGRKLSNGILPQGKLGKIRKGVANNLEKMKNIIKKIRNEDKKIDKDIGKLLKEFKKFSENIKEFEKITNDSLNELMKYIKLMVDLYGNNLNNAYPEIIKLENNIGNLYKMLENIKKNGSSINSILNEIHNLWGIHKHKISKT